MKPKNHSRPNRKDLFNHTLNNMYDNNNTIKQMPSRIPRPTGTTELSNIYNKTNNIEDLHQLQSHIINHYINTNFQYCNRPMNIETFSTYIKVDVSQIHNTMHNTSKVLYNQLTNEGQENISGAIMTMLFGWGLSDRTNALRHATTLQAEMGNAYVPFLSSEVTKALGNVQSTTQNMAQIARTFFGNTAPGIVINNSNNQQNIDNQLTVEKAIQLIDSRATRPSLLEDPESKDALFLEHNLADCPEVNANMQQGIDTRKEGLNFNKLTELKMVDLNALEGNDLGHIDRRANDLEVDLESDQV